MIKARVFGWPGKQKGQDARVQVSECHVLASLGCEHTPRTQCCAVSLIEVFGRQCGWDACWVKNSVEYGGLNTFQLKNPLERPSLSHFLNLTLVWPTHQILSTYPADHFGAATWPGLYSWQDSMVESQCSATAPYRREEGWKTRIWFFINTAIVAKK